MHTNFSHGCKCVRVHWPVTSSIHICHVRYMTQKIDSRLLLRIREPTSDWQNAKMAQHCSGVWNTLNGDRYSPIQSCEIWHLSVTHDCIFVWMLLPVTENALKSAADSTTTTGSSESRAKSSVDEAAKHIPPWRQRKLHIHLRFISKIYNIRTEFYF